MSVQCAVSRVGYWDSVTDQILEKMNCTAFHYKVGVLFCTLFSVYMVIYLTGATPPDIDMVHVKVPNSSHHVSAVECVSSNDFSLTHKHGTDESMQHTFVYTLQCEKLLRGCIFDREKILLLTRTLIWFTHSTYQESLPPVWHPSIPIAHRRLII